MNIISTLLKRPGIFVSLRPNEGERETKAQLAMALRLGRLGAWALEVPSLTVKWSKEARAIHELADDFQLTVDAVAALIDPAWRPQVELAFQTCIDHGLAFDLETRSCTQPGKPIWIRLIGEAVRNGAGKIRRVQGVVQDITQIREATSRANQLNERLTATLERMTDGFFTLDRDWRFTYVNGQAERLLQRPREELLGAVVWNEFPEALGSISHREYERALAEFVTVDFEAFFAPLNTWFKVGAHPSADGLAVYFQDITAAKRARAALDDSEEQYRMLFEGSMDAILRIRRDGSIFQVNPAACAIFGMTEKEICGAGASGLVAPEDPRLRGLLEELARVGKASGELTLVRGDGHQFAAELSSAKYRSSDGEAQAYIVLRDITERLRSRQEVLSLNLNLEARVKQRTAELEAANRSLVEVNRFLDSVIENIPDVLFVKEAPDLRYVRFNRAGEELLGCSREDVLGKTDYALVAHEEADFFRAKDRGVLARGVMEDFPEELLQTSDKGVRILRTRKIPVFDQNNQPRYLLGISSDVTEAKEKEREILRLNTALEQRSAEADAANRAKSTFLATMSHEIRTPMNGMLGMLELLSLTQLDGEQRATLELARESSRSLLRIIDDILDFSKIEAGKVELRLEAASIEKVVEEVENLYSATASGKGLLITRAVDAAISPALLVDPLRLRQILNNLVSNSLKFTSAGSVELRAELVARLKQEDRVRFSIRDTGRGISLEDQKRLFQPFSQGGPDAAQGGTGLGLSICRRLAELMGGTIEMVSELGKGTTMILTLTLPIAAPQDLPVPDLSGAPHLPETTGLGAAPPSGVPPEASATLVLLVDDHPINRILLMRQVTTLGYSAETAEDGVQALALWKSGRFGIVIADCNMPEMDGYELARTIRRLEAAQGLERTPILACTANALESEVENCLAAGMDDCLVKPTELSRMRTKLEQWLPMAKATSTPI